MNNECNYDNSRINKKCKDLVYNFAVNTFEHAKQKKFLDLKFDQYCYITPIKPNALLETKAVNGPAVDSFPAKYLFYEQLNCKLKGMSACSLLI